MARKMDNCDELESANSEKQPLAKQEQLFAQLRSLESVLIAFSGGADSAYLAWAAHQAFWANARCHHRGFTKLFGARSGAGVTVRRRDNAAA